MISNSFVTHVLFNIVLELCPIIKAVKSDGKGFLYEEKWIFWEDWLLNDYDYEFSKPSYQHAVYKTSVKYTSTGKWTVSSADYYYVWKSIAPFESTEKVALPTLVTAWKTGSITRDMIFICKTGKERFIVL